MSVIGRLDGQVDRVLISRVARRGDGTQGATDSGTRERIEESRTEAPVEASRAADGASPRAAQERDERASSPVDRAGERAELPVWLL